MGSPRQRGVLPGLLGALAVGSASLGYVANVTAHSTVQGDFLLPASLTESTASIANNT